jgi:hypothetical protein
MSNIVGTTPKYDPAATVYADAVFGKETDSYGVQRRHSSYRLLNAEYLAKTNVPTEYAAQVPWEDSAGSRGYNFEDIDALYNAGIPGEWATAFHDGLLIERGRIPQWVRLHIDEMVYPIEVYAAGVEAGYAALCVTYRLSAAETIKLHKSVPYEYLGVLL